MLFLVFTFYMLQRMDSNIHNDIKIPYMSHVTKALAPYSHLVAYHRLHVLLTYQLSITIKGADLACSFLPYPRL